MHIGGIAAGGLKELVQVLVALVEVGHVHHFPALGLHDFPDAVVALPAGFIKIQETSGALMGADVLLGFLDIVNGIQHNNIAGWLFAALHYLPGQEVPEAFEDSDTGRRRLGRKLPFSVDGGNIGLGG